MALFWELFKENADKTPDGRKTTANWKKIIEVNLGAMIGKTQADKKFLSQTAEEGVMACAMQSPIVETTQALISSCSNKNVKLQEFSVKALAFHLEFAPEDFLKNAANE